MLDARQSFILKAVIQDYIAEAVPVGSNRIVETYQLAASSATVRNSMAELETLGYIIQLHHSSGRVPTDKGYRFYVNSLMAREHLSQTEKRRIQRECDKRFSEIEQLLLIIGKILSQISGCAAVIQTPFLSQSTVKRIELISIDETKILLVLLTNASSVINRVIEVPSPLTPDILEQMTNMLNAKLIGVPLEQIGTGVVSELALELHHGLFLELIKLIIKAIEAEPQGRLFVEGISNLLGQPECHDVTVIKPVLHLLEEPPKLSKVFGTDSSIQGATCVRIGHENRLKELKEFSTITGSYYLDDMAIGNIGIIGPTRMHYERLIPMVAFMAGSISDRMLSLR